MLRPANSIYRPHFAVWPAKKRRFRDQKRAVCHLAACGDNDSVQDEFDMLGVIAIVDLDTNLLLDVHLLF